METDPFPANLCWILNKSFITSDVIKSFDCTTFNVSISLSVLFSICHVRLFHP